MWDGSEADQTNCLAYILHSICIPSSGQRQAGNNSALRASENEKNFFEIDSQFSSTSPIHAIPEFMISITGANWFFLFILVIFIYFSCPKFVCEMLPKPANLILSTCKRCGASLNCPDCLQRSRSFWFVFGCQNPFGKYESPERAYESIFLTRTDSALYDIVDLSLRNM